MRGSVFHCFSHNSCLHTPSRAPIQSVACIRPRVHHCPYVTPHFGLCPFGHRVHPMRIRFDGLWFFLVFFFECFGEETHSDQLCVCPHACVAFMSDLLCCAGTGGWWYTVSPVDNGTKAPLNVEVRMVHDFLYVGQVSEVCQTGMGFFVRPSNGDRRQCSIYSAPRELTF